MEKDATERLAELLDDVSYGRAGITEFCQVWSSLAGSIDCDDMLGVLAFYLHGLVMKKEPKRAEQIKSFMALVHEFSGDSDEAKS